MAKEDLDERSDRVVREVRRFEISEMFDGLQ